MPSKWHLGRKSAAGFALIALATAALACGSRRETPIDQVRAKVLKFYADLVSGRGREACKVMTPNAQLGLMNITGIAGAAPDPQSCRNAVHNALAQKQIDLAGPVRIVSIRVKRRRAHVTLNYPHADADLLKRDGEWRLDSFALPNANQ